MSRSTDVVPGTGLRHAIALAITGLVPSTYAVLVAADAAIDGFSFWLAFSVTLATAVAGALISVAFPVPSNWELFARAAIVAVVALGIRFTVPSPLLAWRQVRDGEASVLSGTAWLMLLLLAVAYVTGHAVASGTARLATPVRTPQIAFVRDRRAFIAWFWATIFGVFVVGVSRATAGATSSVLVVVCAGAGLLLLADLRLRTAPPGATRPPLVVAPLAIRRAGVVFALVTVGAIAAFATPLVPVETLRSLPSAPDWMLDWGRGDAPQQLVDAVGAGESPPIEEQVEVPEEMRWRGWDVPTPPWPFWAGLGAILLLLLLRPHRWVRGLQRLLAALRRFGGFASDDDGMGELLELEELDAEDLAGRERSSRWQRGLRRLGLRPREPRAAVVHEYLQVSKLLAQREQGRLGPETPHEHAVRVHVSDAHTELADLAADARFGRATPTTDQVARARDLRREIERSLKEPRAAR